MKKLFLLLFCFLFVSVSFADETIHQQELKLSGDLDVGGEITVQNSPVTIYGPSGQYIVNNLSDACDDCTGLRNVGFGGANSVINAFMNTGSGINDGTLIVLDRYLGSADTALSAIEDVPLNYEVGEIRTKAVTNGGTIIQQVGNIRTFVDSINTGDADQIGGRMEFSTAKVDVAGMTTGLIIDDDQDVYLPNGDLYLEGTDDEFEMKITTKDPTADGSVTFPDSNNGGFAEVIVTKNSDIKTATNQSTNAYTEAIQIDQEMAGYTLVFYFSGTITGGNDVKTFAIRELTDGDIISLSAAAGTTGDYVIECKVYIVAEASAAGNINAMCIFSSSAETVVVHDSTAAIDITDSALIRVLLISNDPGDTITSEYFDFSMSGG